MEGKLEIAFLPFVQSLDNLYSNVLKYELVLVLQLPYLEAKAHSQFKRYDGHEPALAIGVEAF